MKALVTGGGFLGGKIVEMLLDRGEQVKVLGRSRYPHLLAKGVECVTGDIRDSSTVNRALKGVDTVFHAAAKAGVWGDREEFFSINSRGTANIIQGCLLNHVEKLVYTSTASVVFNGEDIFNGNESLPYADKYLASYPESKAMGERMVLDAHGWEFVVEKTNPEADEITHRHASTIRKLSTCSLRPHLIWGPGDPHLVPRVLTQASKGKLKCVGEGVNLVSLTYIDHVAQAHLQAADVLAPDSAVGGQPYFIIDPEPVALWKWINHLLRNLNIPPVKRKMPFRPAYALGAGAELLHTLFPRLGEPPITRFVANIFAKNHTFSSEKARRDFNFETPVSPSLGMRRMLEDLQHTYRKINQ